MTETSSAPTSALSGRRAWEVVLLRIERDLLDGSLGPGDHLPPERTLATELGVGRSSVREALRVLEVLGLIRTQVGSGPQSGAIIIATPAGGMSALMRLQVAAKGFAAEDIVKTRLVLETAVVTALASTRAIADLSEATALLDAMESDDALSETEFLVLDAAFHLSLAAASGNDVIASMMTGLRSSIEGYVLAGAAFLPSWSVTSARLGREHRGILAAVQAGDGPRAATLVHDHISGYYAESNLISAPPTTPNKD